MRRVQTTDAVYCPCIQDPRYHAHRDLCSKEERCNPLCLQVD
uniref:Uncharacterized protein n=1 Tax=Anguilla anguilla TaxID=7936 RepID=A0A0E9V3V8_ANGAN